MAWSHKPQYDVGDIQPGPFLPYVSIKDVIQVLGDMWRADDVLQAFGRYCVELAPRLNWLLQCFPQQICEPVLHALRTDSYDDAYDICSEIWTAIETLIYNLGGEVVDLNNILGMGHTHGPTIPVVDLASVEICLENGGLNLDIFSNISIEAYLFNTIHKLYNISRHDEQNICSAFSQIVVSEESLPNLVHDFAAEMISIFIPLVGEICSCWDRIFEQLFPVMEGSEFTVTDFNQIILIAANSLGYNTCKEICDDITISVAFGNGSDFARHLVKEMFTLIGDMERCVCTGRRVLEFLSSWWSVPICHLYDEMYRYTGFNQLEELCDFVGSSFTGMEGKRQVITFSSWYRAIF